LEEGGEEEGGGRREEGGGRREEGRGKREFRKIWNFWMACGFKDGEHG
jgi:hypothetical protein